MIRKRIQYNMNKLFLLVLLVWSQIYFSASIFAQQDAQYTQYMYNMNILNPAYAGSNAGVINISLLGRMQWVEVPDAPKTTTLSVHSSIAGQMGLGLSILADKIGPINEQFVFVDYSYTLPVGVFDNLALGVKAGASIISANLKELETVSSFLGTSATDINFESDINNIKPNFGFGAFYYSDNYYVGLSVPNLLQTTYFEKNGAGNVTNIAKKNHLFLTAGYVFDINYDWKFKPSMMSKAVLGSPLAVDVSANFLYDEAYEIGASYRWDDSVSLLFNAKVTDKLRVGYAYDFTTSSLTDYNSGSHEVIVLFEILTAYEITSPRFF